ncbi:hypothetical protein Kpho01_09640 [Kitasatospora phosalacinea]|uniref:Uncharacterized protein n=1 Tax=Kitasatospora phosalacinea TaxID=2065 RepID=A0A9W6PDH4_9ACTN|nr:hypothetical protein Kpho01_09640 [Kitasatospora phosalacinea]
MHVRGPGTVGHTGMHVRGPGTVGHTGMHVRGPGTVGHTGRAIRGPGNGGLGAAGGALPLRAVASGSVTAARSSTDASTGSGRQQLGPAVPRAPGGALPFPSSA